jgi:hypothetical protein
MLLATSRQNRHPNWDICHIGAQVSVSPRRSLPPMFWPNAARLSSPHHRYRIVLPLQKVREMCTQLIHGESSVFSNLLIHLVKQIGSDWRRTATSIIIVDIRPPFTEHPALSSHHSITHRIFSINFTNLPVKFSRANIFGIQKFDYWPYLTTYGIFFFILISRQNEELTNNEWKLTMCQM